LGTSGLVPPDEQLIVVAIRTATKIPRRRRCIVGLQIAVSLSPLVDDRPVRNNTIYKA
jgi:hypothetical protein